MSLYRPAYLRVREEMKLQLIFFYKLETYGMWSLTDATLPLICPLDVVQMIIWFQLVGLTLSYSFW